MSENENMDLTQETTEPQASTPPTKTDKVKKDKPAEKKKKGGIGRFFREMKSELKKVIWPTRKETLKSTLIVIVCVIIVGIVVWIFDGVASLLIDALISLFKG